MGGNKEEYLKAKRSTKQRLLEEKTFADLQNASTTVILKKERQMRRNQHEDMENLPI